MGGTTKGLITGSMHQLKLFGWAAVCAALALFAISVFGCGDDRRQNLEREVEELRAEVRNLRSVKTDMEVVKAELAGIRSQTESRPAAEQPIIPAETQSNGYLDDPYYGPADARLLITVFSDYQCQSCRQFLNQIFPLLKQEYADTNQARVVLRDLPLASKPHSKAAAAMAHCAGEQGRYWQAFHALLDHSDLLDAGDFQGLVSRIDGVDAKRLELCIKTKKYDREIEVDAADAQQLGARGAPGTFIGIRAGGPEKKLVRGVFVRGAQPFEVIKAEVDKLAAGRPQ